MNSMFFVISVGDINVLLMPIYQATRVAHLSLVDSKGKKTDPGAYSPLVEERERFCPSTRIKPPSATLYT
jgi:hypothetical protein